MTTITDQQWTVVLVSASPRRRDLLAERAVRHTVVTPPDDVQELTTGIPHEVVATNAALKVDGFLSRREREDDEGLRNVWLGVDTIVEYNGRILGKPADHSAARAMLESLSGCSHRVYSAIEARTSHGERAGRVACTTVTFRPLSRWDIDHYLSTAEALDKAGAYGIQGTAGLFVQGIEGCYYNVVGLPLVTLGHVLEDVGLSWSSVIEASARIGH